MGYALAIGSIVATVAGAAVSAYGAVQQGKAQQEMSNYQAEVAQNNAKIATEKGEAQATQVGLANRQKLGAITTGEAASGVDVNTGSAGQVRQSAKLLGQTDVETAKSNAALQNYGFRTQSSLDVFAGENAAAAGNIGAAGSLLSGASSVGSEYAQFKNAGVM